MNNSQTTISHIQNIQECDNAVAEKLLINILNIYEKIIQNLKASHHLIIGVTIVVDIDIALLSSEKNNKTN